jgi:hypothetical protein
MRQFVLQAYDPVLACPVLEARLRISDISAMREILGEAARDDVELIRCYGLDSDDLDAVAALSDVRFKPDRLLTVLAPWQSIREAPYLVHTGYELPLMLEGRKPLAAITVSFQWIVQELGPFESFVKKGRLRKHVFEQNDFQEVYFTLPGEEWRVDAYRGLLAAPGWDDERERRQGELLGYEDWQNDWWMENRASRLRRSVMR